MRARIGPHVIADTAAAMELKEATYPAVIYFPRKDVETGFLSKTDRTSHCPYKGDASYYSILIDGEVLENVVWSYESPFPAMEAITGLLAFYTDRVEVYAAPDEREEGAVPRASRRRRGAAAGRQPELTLRSREISAWAAAGARTFAPLIMKTNTSRGARRRRAWRQRSRPGGRLPPAQALATSAQRSSAAAS